MKHYYLRRSVLLGVMSLMISGSMIAQTIYKDFVDGQIYFKLKDNIKVQAPEVQNGFDPVDPDQLTFIMDDGSVDLSQVFNRLEEHKIRSLTLPFITTDSDKLKRTFKLEFADYTQVDKLVRDLEQIPYIEYAEKIPISKYFYTPNDPFYNQSPGGNKNWNLYKVNAAGAWDFSRGSKDIVVAVLDMGTQLSHQDLSANIWINPDEIANNGIDDDGNGYKDDINGWDMAVNDNDPNPPKFNDFDWSHGTNVAGIVGASTDNGIGIASIGFNLSMMIVKTSLDGTKPTVTNGDQAIAYAADNGAHVINMSWGSYTYSATQKNAIDYAAGKGVVLVAAAGNEGASNKAYPASLNNVIAVAGVDQNEQKVGSSNYGSWVDISAPGENIPSTFSATSPTPPYGNWTGTSFAAPMVSGLCGLMLSMNSALTPAQVENCIKSNAVNINGANPSHSGLLGSGRIDAAATMQCVAATVPANDAGIVMIKAPTGLACAGDITPKVTLRNFGSSSLTNVTIKYQVGSGAVVSKTWSGNLTPYTETDVTLNSSVAASGEHIISVWTEKPNDKIDGNIKNNKKSIKFVRMTTSTVASPISESFESAFPPAGWVLNNPDNDNTWEQASVGSAGSKSVRMNNFKGNVVGHLDELVMPPLDMTKIGTPKLTFQYAYAQKDGNSKDRLRVLVSYTCGSSWLYRLIKTGSTLTTTSAKTFEFTPNNSEWKTGELDLSTFADKEQLYIKFEFSSYEGNHLYLDDIRISGAVGIEDKMGATEFEVFPNPAKGEFNINVVGQENASSLRVLNVLGETVWSKEYSANSYFEKIDLLNQPEGIYFIELRAGQTIKTQRLVNIKN